MRAKLILLTTLSVAMSGCATVDMTNMAGQATAPATAKTTQVNVVQRAASKLYAAFTSNGWVAKSSRKRVQSTADVLLKGLAPQTDLQKSGNYAVTAVSLTKLAADIRAAEHHVFQTTKAAEVYLAMAADDVNVRSELSSLEKALIAARQAELVFAAAIDTASTTSDGGETAATDFAEYQESVNKLRDVTDLYGDRVRQIRTRVSAATFG